MKGKVCVVTGANSGVGFATVLTLARLGAQVVLVCRTRARGETALKRIVKRVPSADLSLAVSDLASLEQVRRLGSQLAANFPGIDLLVNNAGVYRAGLEQTEDGFERTLMVNHLSHFLLTHMLLSSLLRAGGRVINVSSNGHRGAKLTRAPLEEIIRGHGGYSGVRAYCDSKLANILFTAELARRYPADRLSVVALHPGVLATRIWNRNLHPLSLFMRLFKPFMGRPSVGGDAVVYLAQAPAEEVHGRYFDKKKRSEPAPMAQDPNLARDLWNVSAALVGLASDQVPAVSPTP